ncbi:MAG: SURF1 family protein [Proteobacteria bacterium]|nr:SURF1 family protein [Pseudomonadota bacterium]
MRRDLILPGLFTLIGVIVLVGLGAWQWSRMGEKEALVATIRARSVLAPEPFPAASTWATMPLADMAYRPVSLSGHFDHGHESHIFFSLAKPVNGVGGPGYLIVAPFVLDSGGTVLVNRGFVPQARKEKASRAEGQTSGPLTITGLVRLPEMRGMFSGTDDPGRNVYFIRDPAALAKAQGLSGIAPVMVDQKTPMPPGGLPMPAQTQVEIPNNHFSYALTWWSLAASLAVIFLLFARQPRS